PYFYGYKNNNIIKITNLPPIFYTPIHNLYSFKKIKLSIMKKIEAIIRKSKFEPVRDELHQVEVNFFSYWDVTGVCNEKKGHVYRGVSYSTTDIQRRYISIVVSDAFLERTIEAILKSAFTGNVGDGKIVVSEVLEAYRIRTREKGQDSLN